MKHTGEHPTSDQPQHDGDRILDHSRLQLSALLDGAMPLDEARFLLRRLQHDEELAACLGRWQLLGDVMRGQALAPADPAFPRRVAAAIAMPAAGTRARWLRWSGGAALAASVALVALFLDRSGPVLQPSPSPPAQVATAAPAITPTPAAPSRAPAPSQPDAPGPAAQLATAVAVADLPRRAAARRSRGQSQRAGRRGAPASEPATALASAAMPGSATATTTADPFAPRNAVLPSRPWPHALLPNARSGAFTVDYGGVDASSYGPFAPRSSMPVAPQPDAGGETRP